MSEIVDAIKDAVNPKRRQEATVETYDPEKRGPYTDQTTSGDAQPQVSPSTNEGQDARRAEQTNLSNPATGSISAGQHGGGTIANQTLNMAEESSPGKTQT